MLTPRYDRPPSFLTLSPETMSGLGAEAGFRRLLHHHLRFRWYIGNPIECLHLTAVKTREI